MTAAVLVPGLFSVLVVLISYLISRRKTRAETSEITVNIALSLLTPLREQVDKLQERVAVLEAQHEEDKAWMKEMEKGIDLLTQQIIELGHEPRWTRT